MPIFNWFKIHHDGKFEFLQLDPTQPMDGDGFEALKHLHDEYMDAFGIDQRYQDYKRAEVALERMYIYQHLTGKKDNQLLINHAVRMMEKQFPDEKKINYNEGIIAIENDKRFKLPLKDTTVWEYYCYIKEITEKIKRQREHTGTRGKVTQKQKAA